MNGKTRTQKGISSEDQHPLVPGRSTAAEPPTTLRTGANSGNSGPTLPQLLAAAKSIMHAGYPLLPIKRNSKRPTAERGKNDATTDRQRFNQMIKPGDNIGIAWPRGVLGVDIDVPKDANDEPLPGAREHADGVAADLEGRFSELRNTPTLRTRSEGLLYIVALPDGTAVPSKVGAVPGIDLRGDGRTYTLVEPSEIRGRRYEWERPLVPRDQLPLASTALLDYLMPSTVSTSGTPKLADLAAGGAGAQKTIEGDPASYAQGLLKHTNKRLSQEKRGRNIACYAEALTLGRWLGGYEQASLPGLTVDDAHATLIAAMDANGDYADDPRKAENTIKRGLDDGMASAYVIAAKSRPKKPPAGLQPRDPRGPGPEPIEAEERARHVADSPTSATAATPKPKPHAPRATIISAAELASRELPPLRPVVADMIVPGLNVFAGPYKLGKSWFVLQMGHSVATNTRFFNREVHPGRVILFSLEDGERRLKERLERQGIDARHLDTLMFSTELPKLDKGGFGELERVLDRYSDTRMIVIDTWTRFKPRATSAGNAYDQDSEHAAMLQRLALERDIALVLVTHVRKMPAEDPFDMITGSVGLHGTADSLIMLARKRGESDGVLRVTARDLGEREDALSFDPQTGTWTMLGSAQEYSQTTQRRSIIQAVRTLSGLGMSTGPKAVAEQLDGEVSANTVRQLMPRMVVDGTLLSPTRGTYVVAEDA